MCRNPHCLLKPDYLNCINQPLAFYFGDIPALDSDTEKMVTLLSAFLI
jgi:hypothetical protein